MAYYAALVSAIRFLKEMSFSDYQYPKSLFKKEQIKSLYEKLKHLYVLLEDHSPNDKEVAGFMDRIRDAACLAQGLIEFHIPSEEKIFPDIPLPEILTRRPERHFPFNVRNIKSMVELQIGEKIRRPSPSSFECIHVVLLYFVSRCRNSENASEKAVYTLRRGYEDLWELTRQLGSIALVEYEALCDLHEAVGSIKIRRKGLDTVKLMEGFIPTVMNGYQDLLKLKEELDTLVEREEDVKEAVDSIFGLGRQNVERVKEALNFHLLELVKEAVDLTLGRGYQDLEWLTEEVDADSFSERGCRDWQTLKAEVDIFAIEGYKKSSKLSEELGAILRRCGFFVTMRMKEEIHQYSENARKKIGFVMEKGYKFLFEKVKEEVDSIVKDLKKIKEKSHTTHQDYPQVGAGPSDGTTMVGIFEQHIKTLKDQLCGDSPKREVISIVGMGGLGKTTLARNIFHDKFIHDRFHFRVWVTISQSYCLRDILVAIANSLNIIKKGESHEVGEDVLRERIRKHLFGWSYLIIMDDVWDLKIWDEVKNWVFPDDERSRSRIIITTRQSDVASLARASDFINQIPLLGYDQSWDLFCAKVFCPPELKDIGRLIVQNCRGLPLAIVVVAGLLSKVNKTRYDWEEVARDVGSAVTKNDENFSRLLSLSYSYLPHHLKPCFLYFGGFPEDYEMSVSRLVKLWYAEGFLKPIATMSLEDAAEEYLKELVNRNLVVITKLRSNGKFRCCSIHDLLRDLCLERAHSENFLLLGHKHSDTEHIHRFFFHSDSPLNSSLQEKKILHVRSIISFGKTSYFFPSYRYNFLPLRVLDAGTRTVFIDRCLELLHLRYLKLLAIDAPIILPIIVLFQNLETLIVEGTGTFTLPPGIWKMPRLEHVMIDKVKLPSIPAGARIIREAPLLRFLQTLYRVVDFSFSSSNVAMIPNLKKLKLEASDCDPRRNCWAKYGLENLIHLHQLETLDISFSREFRRNEDNVIPFPVSFSFPLSLKKLSLKGCNLPWKDLTVVGSLPNLEILKLRRGSFVGREWEPIEGEFLKLKYLLIDGLDDLEYWGAEKTHFPCLEQLHISRCEKLEIPTEVGDISNLQLIELCSCSPLMEKRAKEIQLQQQEDYSNYGLQVRFVQIWYIPSQNETVRKTKEQKDFST